MAAGWTTRWSYSWESEIFFTPNWQMNFIDDITKGKSQKVFPEYQRSIKTPMFKLNVNINPSSDSLLFRKIPVEKYNK